MPTPNRPTPRRPGMGRPHGAASKRPWPDPTSAGLASISRSPRTDSSVAATPSLGSLAMHRIKQTVRSAARVRGETPGLGGHALTSRGEPSRPVQRAAGCDPNHLERTYGTDASLSTPPIAERHQRDRQRPAAPVPAPAARLPHPDPSRPRRHRRPAQRQSSTQPRLQDHHAGQPRCCVDRLNSHR